MYHELNAGVSGGIFEAERKFALRRLYLVTFVLFVVVAGGSFASVFFGISEIVRHDTILMNDGLGEVMTILGICFAVPSLFCMIVFAALTLNPPCSLLRIPHFSLLLVIGPTLISFVVQQALCDLYLFRFAGSLATLAVIADVCVLVSYTTVYFWRFYVPTVLSVLLFAGKTAALWSCMHGARREQQPVVPSNVVFTMLILTIPVIQFPLYITETRVLPGLEDLFLWEDKVVKNFNSNFNLLLLHLLNSLDILAMYNSIFSPLVKDEGLVGISDPFRVLILVFASIGFVGNNLSVIHLFYARDGVEHAGLMCLPKKLRDCTNQWSSTDVRGNHKLRILQYMLLLLVVCDAPFLSVRMQLWWRGHQMLSVFVIKNVKAILDTTMVILRVEQSSVSTDRGRYHLFENR